MEDLIKPRFRFTEEFDLHLAREVCGQNPYEDPRRWSMIQVNMIQITGRSISIRTLRERIQNLVKKFLTKAKLNEGKSGIEEIVTELDDLIQQIVDLIKTFENKKKVCTSQQKLVKLPAEPIKSSFQKGFDAREKFVEESRSNENNMMDLMEKYTDDVAHEIFETVEIENEPPIEKKSYNYREIEPEAQQSEKDDKNGRTPKKRSLAQANILSPSNHKRTYTNIKQHTVQYLTKKNDRQYEIRSRELALAERKQSLEEKKFQMEAEERQKRIQMEERRLALEEKRLNIQLEIFENQQNLMKIILEKNL